jgi:arsenate reductase
MTATICHNPGCGTSRDVLGLIRNTGDAPAVIEYLKAPPSSDALKDIIARMHMPVRDVVRREGTPYEAIDLDDPKLSDDQLLDAMMAHPILIGRPVVVTPKGVKLRRPSESVLDILEAPQRGIFTKKDGEKVVDSSSNRILRFAP